MHSSKLCFKKYAAKYIPKYKKYAAKHILKISIRNFN